MKRPFNALRTWIENRSKEPWGLLALLLISLLEIAVTNQLTLAALNRTGFQPEAAIRGTNAFPPLIILLLLVNIVAWALDWDRILRWTIFIFAGVVTVKLCASIYGLVVTLPLRQGEFGPESLLRDALLVWITNVLVFTIWYWMLDRGGPEKRKRGQPERPDFIFAQHRHDFDGWQGWHPTFVDYLFLAFIMSTNFSVPDVEVLSHRAKWLMMIQVANSLITLGMVVARAISIIG